MQYSTSRVEFLVLGWFADLCPIFCYFSAWLGANYGVFQLFKLSINNRIIQCFEAVGCLTGRAFGPTNSPPAVAKVLSWFDLAGRGESMVKLGS